jgi:hypothetical protein
MGFPFRGAPAPLSLISRFVRSERGLNLGAGMVSLCENIRRLGASGVGQFIGCKFCGMIEAEGDHLSGYSDTTKCSICPIASLKLTRKIPTGSKYFGAELSQSIWRSHTDLI